METTIDAHFPGIPDYLCDHQTATQANTKCLQVQIHTNGTFQRSNEADAKREGWGTSFYLLR